MEITVSSTGGALEHQPNRLGKFSVAGSLWDNMVPFWVAENNQYITPDPNSNPIIYYVRWEVTDAVGSLNSGKKRHLINSFISVLCRVNERRLHLWV